MRANYRQIPELIAQKKTFTGQSVTARIEEKYCPTCYEVNHYVVISYATEIFTKCLTCGVEEFNETKYSRTTSKLQNIIKRLANHT